MANNMLSDTRELTPQELQPDSSFTFRIGNEAREYSYQQAFALGHSLVLAKNFGPAAVIFEKLSKVNNRGPRAHIMLAICKAGLSDYREARFVLDRAFVSETRPVAAAIHEVIVESRMGLKEDALKELLELVNEHKELPTLCLWLGDLLAAGGQSAKAVQCWKLAIKRDRPEGAVALAATRQLKRVAKSPAASKAPSP